MKKTWLTLLAACALFIVPFAVHAQQTTPRLALSISPPLAEITIQPGRSAVYAFNITNDGGANLDATPMLVDFTVDENGNPVNVLDKPSSFRYASLQNLDKALNQSFSLPAGASDQLVLRIEIPKDAQERDYYQTLLLKTTPVKGTIQAEGTTASAGAYIGVRLLISISKSGINTGKLDIAQLTAPKIVDTFFPLTFSLTAKNTGASFTKAQGEVSIRSDITGKVVKVFPILPENVLAYSARELHAAGKDPDDEKSMTPEPFSYKPIALFGPYTIRVDVHGENQPSNEKTTQVWALPISLAIIPLAIALAVHLLRFIQKHGQN